MEYHDKVLKCSECSQELFHRRRTNVFSPTRALRTSPSGVKDCKSKRSQSPGQGNLQRSETKTTCSQCGKETTVPFRPTQGVRVLP